MSRYKGALNYRTREAAEMARGIVTSPEYLASLRERAIAGTLGPMEPVLWYFGFGKPKDRVDLNIGVEQEDLSTLSIEELQDRAKGLLDQIADVKAFEESWPSMRPMPEVTVVTVKALPKASPEDERETLVRLLAEQAGLERLER